MSSGDKDFDKEDQKPDGERIPDAQNQPGEAPPEIPEVPPPQPEDVPGIAVHVPERPQRERGFSLSLARMFKRMSGRATPTSPRHPRKKRIIAAGLAATIGVCVGIPALWLLFNPLPDIAMLEHYTPVEAVKIYDIHDKLAGVVAGDEDRLSIKLANVSPIMLKAMLAAEDHEFYSHGGFNMSSIARAALKNMQAGRVVEGASTITQQLVKNLFFPGEARTFNRKIKEAILATQIDQKYTKDQILEMYLNQIYFGNQSYGIERAAQRYFNKSANKLNLGEAAFLAGVVKAPSYLSNPAHRKQAIERQHAVLDKMVEYKLISSGEAGKAKSEKLVFRKYVSPYQKYAFYVAYVMDLLRENYGDEEIQRGLKVYTNLDPEAQIAGEKALQKGIDKAPSGVEQGAIASVRIDDGAVLALVGGVGQYEKHQWNRAVSPHTMGSSFKPFVYLTGFVKGHSPDDIIVDSPVSFPSGGRFWSPPNFEHGFMGAMTMRKALAFSRNVCAAKLAYEVGIENVIKTARLAGLTSRMEPYMPISLGAAAASPLEMAAAYSTFARGGIAIKPLVFRRIESNDGKVIAAFKPEPRKVFDSTATTKLLDCMQEVVKAGTGVRARLPGRPLAGKTGTSDASRDIWFVGFTADTATACWGGNDHNKAIHNRGVTGGMIMSNIFKDYMTEFYEKHPTPALAFVTPAANAPQIAIDGMPPPVANGDKKKGEEQKKVAQADANTKALKKMLKPASAHKVTVVERTFERAAVAEDEDKTETSAPGEEPAEAAETPQEEGGPNDAAKAAPEAKSETESKPALGPAREPSHVAPGPRFVTPPPRLVTPESNPVTPEIKPAVPESRTVAPQPRPAAPEPKPVAPESKPAARSAPVDETKPAADTAKPVHVEKPFPNMHVGNEDE